MPGQNEVIKMRKTCLLIGVILLGFLVTGCSKNPINDKSSNNVTLNDNPPSYLKSIVAYKEGYDGIAVYIILADYNGIMTTADGEMKLEIFEIHYDYYHIPAYFDSLLFSLAISVKKSFFSKTKVGIGAFEHEVIMLYIGRIPYSNFSKPPSEMSGKVRVNFITNDGRSLYGEEIIYF